MFYCSLSVNLERERIMTNLSKRLISAFLSFVLIIPLCISFEKSVYAESFGGWSVSFNNGAKGEAYIDTENAYSGVSSLKIINETPSAANVYAGAYYNVNVEAGKKYKVGAKIKSLRSSNIFFCVSWETRYSLRPFGDTYEWTNFEVTHTAKESGAKVLQFIVDGVTDGFWIDDVKFIDLETGENLVVGSDSTFEEEKLNISDLNSDMNNVTELYNTIKKSETYSANDLESVIGGFKNMFVYKQKDITIDGNSEDWEGYTSCSIPTLPTQYQIYLKDGKPLDANMTCKFAQDDENFYLLIEVVDDVYNYVEGGQNYYWQGDSLQFAISEMASSTGTALAETYGTEFGLAYNPVTDECEIYSPDVADDRLSAAVAKASHKDGKTVFETAIPWNIKFVERPAGILFDILYNDNDGDGRRYCVELAPGIAEGKNNSQFPKLEMLDEGQDWYAWVQGPRDVFAKTDYIYEYYLVNKGGEKTFTVTGDDGQTETVTVPAGMGIRHEFTANFNKVGEETLTKTFSSGDSSYTGNCEVSVVDKPATAEYHQTVIDKNAKHVEEIERLLAQCEKKGITTDYETAYYSILKKFDTLLADDLKNNFFDKTFYQERTLDEVYEKAKTNLTAYLNGEKEPKSVPKYVTSDVRMEGPVMYGTTNENGKLEERPVIFAGFGHFADARADVPIFQNFGFNTAQFEIGPSYMMINTTMASCWGDAIAKTPDYEGKIDTTHKRNGNSSFKITYKSPETSGQNMYVYQFVPVTEGKTYILSGYVKANNANKVYISARDSQERVYVDGTYDWTEVSSKYTAPADTEYTIIRIGCEGPTDEVYFDDFTFCEEGSNINILRNGDFEKAPEEIMEINPHAKSIYDLKKVLKNSEENNLALSVLISPHYFPAKIIEKYDIHHPKLMFLKYNINAEPAKKILTEYFNTIIPIIREYKSVQNICLLNEPAFRVDLCGDFYLDDWHQYLRELYDNDISKLNKAYEKNFEAFEDVDFVMTNYAKRYDFKNFNDSVFSDWRRWLSESVKALAPEIPVQIKRMNYFEPTNSLHVYIGTDVENDYDFVDMNGCDCGDYVENESDALVQTMWYDMLRSGKDVPVLNTEDHIMTNGSDVYTEEQRDYVVRNLHIGAIHGRSMSNMWVWAKSYEEGNVFADSILFRPDVLAGISDITMDMNRNSYEIAALQNAEREVGILYSDASIISNVSTPYAVYQTYAACMYNGKAIKFIYPSQLGSMNDVKILFVPKKTHVVAETLDYISDYIKSGGKVVIIGSDSLRKNEYGYDHDAEKIKFIYDNSQIIEYSGANDKIENMTETEYYNRIREALKSNGLYNVAVKDSKTGEALDLVEYNVGYYNGKVIISMINYNQERTVNVYLGDTLVEKSYELYKDETLGSEITLSKYVPAFIAIDVENPFIDTYGHWAEKTISALHSEGIIKGVKESVFAPQKTLTRAEFLTLLMRCTEKTGTAVNTLPGDVARNTWYASSVGEAVNKGIIRADENFRPDDYITREEMCTLLVKCYEQENGAQSEDAQLDFSDAEMITNVTDVKKAVALGLMNGHADGSFAPQNTATRAESAAVIERFKSK